MIYHRLERSKAFADTYPLHILTIPTVREFARALALPMDDGNAHAYDEEEMIQRFRPNIVVSNPSTSAGAYEEDRWGLVDIGEDGDEGEGERGGLEVVGRCGRCTVSPPSFSI